LHKRGDDTCVSEQITDAMIQVYSTTAELMSGKQGERGFKAGETKRREKKNHDEQAELWLRERVRPLIYFWP
jgi:hypothetical protein